jgi:hypothetical protein
MIDSSVIRNNTATYGGAGGFMVDMNGTSDSVVLVQNALFYGNRARSYGGAGLAVYGNLTRNSLIRISNTDFVGNELRLGSGGGLLTVLGPPTTDRENNVTVQLENVTMRDNSVLSGVGGGWYVEGTTTAYEDCWNYGWSAATACGASVRGRNLTFVRNNATYGGGLFAIDSQAAIQASSFLDNIATWFGGALFAKRMLAMLVDGTTFVGNRCALRAGHSLTVLVAAQQCWSRSSVLVIVLCCVIPSCCFRCC